MKKGDILWGLSLLLVVFILVNDTTHKVFVDFTSTYPYIGGFLKFFILASMGDLLGLRIAKGRWEKPIGLFYKAVIWGLIGIVIVVIFGIFANGVNALMDSGLLPFGCSSLITAFTISLIMNLTFAPTMMAFHRVTDTYIEMKHGDKSAKLDDAIKAVDWHGFIKFVVFKTIPLFWIPAHTITFLLPPEYRVLLASLLGIALGLILGIAKLKKS